MHTFWLAVLSLAAALTVVRTDHALDRLNLSPYIKQMARMMKLDPIFQGTCGSKCCVTIERPDGDTETLLLDIDDGVPDPSDPCSLFICTSDGLVSRDLTCSDRTCSDGLPPVEYPRQCCPKCPGVGGPGTCSLTQWSDWGRCNVQCGGEGRQVRTRRIRNIDDSRDSVECVEDLTQVQPCNNGPCPVDCKWRYRPWGECSAECGGGTQKRYPFITQEAMYGGNDCPDFVHKKVPQSRACNTDPCKNCKWEWKPWTTCSKTCGGGTKSRGARIIEQGVAPGEVCPPYRINGVEQTVPQVESCNTQSCPKNCKWEWKPWTACSKTCGGGTRSRGASIIEHGLAPGEVCPPYRIKGVGQTVPQVESCNTKIKCPEACKKDEHECPVGKAKVCVKNKYKGCDHCKIKGYKKAIDWDLDSVHNSCDNCKKIVNSNQVDTDGDRVGDLCDNCPGKPNRLQIDTDYDKIGDACDPENNKNPHADEPMDYETNVVTPVDGIIQKLFEMLNGDE